jgi:hypothetical protein
MFLEKLVDKKEQEEEEREKRRSKSSADDATAASAAISWSDVLVELERAGDEAMRRMIKGDASGIDEDSFPKLRSFLKRLPV